MQVFDDPRIPGKGGGVGGGGGVVVVSKHEKGEKTEAAKNTFLATLTTAGGAQNGLLQGQLGGLSIIEVLKRHLK